MNNSSQIIKKYINEISATLTKLPVESIEQVVHILESARTQKKRVFLLGNGGSAATASHFACDLAKGAITDGKPRFRTMALTDNLSLLSAWANDDSYDVVFAQQLEGQVEPGDVVIGISGSGRSANVLNAMNLARSSGAITIGLTGFDGGELENLVDICITVPNNSMEQIEDIHLLLEHIITACLRLAP